MIRLQFREAVILSVLVVAGLILFLVKADRRPSPEQASPETLIVYCAAGLEPPVSRILHEYQASHSVSFQTQFGGSGSLLSQIRVAGGGDLFVAADVQYLLTARKMELVDDILPIAVQTPVIIVARGNPKKIRDLSGLLAPGVRLSLADPKMAAIGKVVKGLLINGGQWDRLWTKAVIHRETVNQVANDVKLSAADAGIVWDATAAQYPELEIIHAEQLDHSMNEIALGILTSTKNPAAAREFADYLTAPDTGLAVFRQFGYKPANPTPETGGSSPAK
jgi:molybdate transport system substrate-binding protein